MIFLLPLQPSRISVVLMLQDSQQVFVIVVHSIMSAETELQKAGFSKIAQAVGNGRISTFPKIADLFFPRSWRGSLIKTACKRQTGKNLKLTLSVNEMASKSWHRKFHLSP